MLYVLRHGETDGNKVRAMGGHIDIPLNQNGINQAVQAREEISKLDIDLIISSPLKRTRCTALIACPGKPIIYDERLISRDHGEFQGKDRLSINLKEYWNIWENKKYEKAESVKDLYMRVKNLIDEIEKKYPNKNILLSTHSGVTRILYYYFNGIPEDGDLTEYTAVNAKVEKYDLNKKRGII